MAIPSSRYVDITSSVGGAAQVSARMLVLRHFTNAIVPRGSVWEFSNADDVGLEFGFISREYSIALKYFGFVDKTGRSPKVLQFALWSDAVNEASILGGVASDLTTLKAITGSDLLTVTMNGIGATPASLDCSGAADQDAVAALIEDALQLNTGAESWTCVYDSGSTKFTIADPATPTEFNATTIPGNDTTLTALGMDSASVTLTNATIIEEPFEAISYSIGENNNCGSLTCFARTGNRYLTEAQITAIAEWNHARNVEFQYHFASPDYDTDFYDAIKGYSGTGSTYYTTATAGEFQEILPCALLAATDYSSPSAAKNYMYTQMAGLTPTVTTSALANALDAIRCNYYGQTQEAGNQISFYQRGYLMGLSNAPTQMGVYANEQWFKAYLKASFLNLLLAMPIFPADDSGVALALATIDDAILVAKDNGVISQGKELDNTQKNYITAITSETDAWETVRNTGTWISAEVVPVVVNDVTEYAIDYAVIYLKRDAVNKITGRHILI